MKKLEKIRDFIVYRDERFFSSFPSVVTLPDGDVLVAFRRARDVRWLLTEDDPQFSHIDHWDCRSHIAALRLDGDSLEPITEVYSLPADPEAGDQDANLLLLSDGRLLQYGFLWYPAPATAIAPLQTQGAAVQDRRSHDGLAYLHWGSYCRHSDDGGKSWSNRVTMPAMPELGEIVPGKRPNHGGSLRGRGVELDNGDILLPGYYGHPDNEGRDGSFCFISRDRGANFEFHSKIAVEPTLQARFQEPALFRTANEDVIALHRTGGLDDRLVVSRKTDKDGWSRPQLHNVTGHPYDCLALGGDAHLAVYGYRHKPFGVRARMIKADMADFGDAPEIIIRDDSPSGDVGYPWATRLSGGRVLVVYYMSDAHGFRHIAASVLKVENR